MLCVTFDSLFEPVQEVNYNILILETHQFNTESGIPFYILVSPARYGQLGLLHHRFAAPIRRGTGTLHRTGMLLSNELCAGRMMTLSSSVAAH